MRPRIARACSAGQFCFFATRSRFFVMVPIARSTNSGLASTSSTPNPLVANTWAMPLPITPPPTTATRLTAADGPVATASVIVLIVRLLRGRAGSSVSALIGREVRSGALDRQRHGVAAAEAQRREAGLRVPLLECGAAVVQARRVAGGDHTALVLRHGGELRQHLGGRVRADRLVLRDDYGIAPALRDRHRRHLARELARRPCGRGLLVALGREGVDLL